MTATIEDEAVKRAELDRLRADAQAAVALVLEQAGLAVANVEIGFHDGISGEWHPMAGPSIISAACAAIRSIAPADGLAAVEALRKERDDALELAEERLRGQHRLSNQLNDTVRDLSAELAAAQQWEAGLTDAVERLVVVLDRNDKKGPIPDVEMMFCWLAAQDIRAAFRAALSHTGETP